MYETSLHNYTVPCLTKEMNIEKTNYYNIFIFTIILHTTGQRMQASPILSERVGIVSTITCQTQEAVFGDIKRSGYIPIDLFVY